MMGDKWSITIYRSSTISIMLRRIAIHILFWFVICVIYYKNVQIRGIEEHYWEFMAWAMPIDWMAVYFTAYFLVPRFLMRKKYVLFFTLVLVSAFSFISLERLLQFKFLFPKIYPAGLEDPFFFLPEIWYTFITLYSFVFLFSGVRLYRTWLEDQKKQVELEKQGLDSELALLRSQINPHFLFNTLNNIDSLVFKDQQKASDSIVRLSEIMRYMLYEANTKLVPLEKEIQYLESMVDLLRLRVKDPEFILFDIDGEVEGKMIPPMLLVPFVENAYKHGIKSGVSPGIQIKLIIDAASYHFSVFNRIDSSRKQEKDQTGGIGLSNVRRRLELLYGDAASLEMERENGAFRVELEIPVSSPEGEGEALG